MNRTWESAALVLFVLVGAALVCVEGAPEAETTTGVPAEPEATLEKTSYEEFAQTAIKEAREEQERGRLDAVTVWLLAHADLYGTGFNYAQANYAPDGGGFSGDDGWRWQVRAVDTAWTDAQLRLRLLWEGRRDEHTGADSRLDEEALRRAGAAELGVHPDSLLLPLLWPRNYEVNR